MSLGTAPKEENVVVAHPSVGEGIAYYNYLDFDISHCCISVSFLRDFYLSFNLPERGNELFGLFFYKGPSSMIRFMNPEYEGTLEKTDKDINVLVLTNLSNFPALTIGKGSRMEARVLIFEKSSIVKEKKNHGLLELDYPMIISHNLSLIHGQNEVLPFDSVFSLLSQTDISDELELLNWKGDVLKVVSNCVSFFRNNINKVPTQKVHLNDREKLTKVERKVIDCLVGSLPSLNYLASEVGMSKTKMCSLFRIFYGTSINSYYQQKKIGKACDLLLETNMSIKEIAQYLGFNNQAYFSRMFKRQLGLVPRSYRSNALARKKTSQIKVTKVDVLDLQSARSRIKDFNPIF